MSDEGAVRLSIASGAGQLTMSVAKGTLVHKATVPFEEERVTAASRQLLAALGRGARQRALTQACLAEMRTLGEELYRALFPHAIRDELSEIGGRPLLLEMDESFVAVPWELVYDGRAFLCRRFDVGRAVSTRLARRSLPHRAAARPAQMLVLCSDPRGDLPGVADEGQALIDVLGDHRGVSLRMVSDRTVEFVRGSLKDYDLVHFAGHAEHRGDDPSTSGWVMSDGLLSARAVADLAGGRPMPTLVFANACSSSRDEAWRDEAAVFGLANAFLVAGVKYYMGTLYDVVDDQSRAFARAFWNELGRGRSIGAAVRRAREAVVVASGEGALGWAGYVLYGDPTFAPLSAADAPAPLPNVPTPRDIAERESLKGVIKRMRRPAQRRAAPRRPALVWLLALLVFVAASAAAVWLATRP